MHLISETREKYMTFVLINFDGWWEEEYLLVIVDDSIKRLGIII